MRFSGIIMVMMDGGGGVVMRMVVMRMVIGFGTGVGGVAMAHRWLVIITGSLVLPILYYHFAPIMIAISSIFSIG